MSVDVAHFVDEEPPSTRAQRVVGKGCQLVLFAVCAGPVAVFPIGLIYKACTYLFP
jgi:hypothetical protein